MNIRQILAALGIGCAAVAGYVVLPSSGAPIAWPEGYVDRVYCDAGPAVCDGITTQAPYGDAAEEAFSRLRGPVFARDGTAEDVAGLYTDAVVLPWPADPTKCDVHYLQHRVQSWATDGAVTGEGIPAGLVTLAATLKGNACYALPLASLPARLKSGAVFRHGFAGHIWSTDAGTP